MRGHVGLTTWFENISFLFNFLDNLEKYLKEVNKTIEFKKNMEEIELVCHVEMTPRGKKLSSSR